MPYFIIFQNNTTRDARLRAPQAYKVKQLGTVENGTFQPFEGNHLHQLIGKNIRFRECPIEDFDAYEIRSTIQVPGFCYVQHTPKPCCHRLMRAYFHRDEYIQISWPFEGTLQQAIEGDVAITYSPITQSSNRVSTDDYKVLQNPPPRSKSF